MSNDKWKKPFKQLKDKLQVLYDANLNVYHGVLMAPFHEANEVGEVVSELEASFSGEILLSRIDVSTDNCCHHAHYFFGNNNGLLNLKRSLDGIEDWIEAIPKSLVPTFQIPKLNNQVEENLVRWANLVYFLAWKIKSPYLQAMVEYKVSINGGGSFPWEECPQPSGCDPRPLLIHQGDTSNQMQELKAKFSDEDLNIPDIIDAYLIGESMIMEFIACSITAIDCLTLMLEQKVLEVASDIDLEIKDRKKRSKSSRVENEIEMLKNFLIGYHKSERIKGNEYCPLTAEEIAHKMEWFSDNEKPLQSKVSRRMRTIFGENPMEKYRAVFQDDDPAPQGFKKVDDDGSIDLEGYYEDRERDSD